MGGRAAGEKCDMWEDQCGGSEGSGLICAELDTSEWRMPDHQRKDMGDKERDMMERTMKDMHGQSMCSK